LKRRTRRTTQKRQAGAFALVAALIVGIAVLVVSQPDDDDGVIPAAEPSSAAPAIETGFALIDLDGGDPISTGIVAGSSGVDVSPDGTEIVYANDTSVGGASVHVANIDGSNVRAFDRTAAAGEAVAPRWSPDGTKVVYQGSTSVGNDIGNLYVLDVRTGRVTQITDLEPLNAGLYYMAPTFSSDGDTVLFTKPTRSASGGDPQTRWDLWTVPVTGGEPTLVRRNATGSDFAPDGDLIAYSRATVVDGRFEFGDLYVARSDGSGARKLVDGGEIWLPRWSPDGSQIGYTDVERNGLYVVDIDTGGTEQILDSDEWAEWVDENTMIVDLAD
jgi:Tol biopolymer transport system component